MQWEELDESRGSRTIPWEGGVKFPALLDLIKSRKIATNLKLLNMKKKQFTPERISKILKEFEVGKNAAEISRAYGVSQAAFYKWRQRDAGMQWVGAVLTDRICA